MFDAALGESEVKQLITRNHSVLPSR